MMNSKRAMTIAAGMMALATSHAALADAIVVRSNGPSATSYPVGRRLPTAERVVLRAGDRVVLVGEGGTRTLSGPGNFPVRIAVRPTQGRSATLGRYLSTADGSISRTGAVRGPGSELPPSQPNVWLVDVARSGTWCTTNPANVQLWRSNTAQDAALRVENVANAAQHSTIGFVEGQSFRSWPTETLPISEGVTYRISGPGMATPSTVSFVTLTGVTEDLASIATALSDKGCTTQLSLLGDQLANSAP